MSICPACQREFACGVSDGNGAQCWCMDLPPLALGGSCNTGGETATASCYCPQCLQQKRRERAGAAGLEAQAAPTRKEE